jgi:hypothetical protein
MGICGVEEPSSNFSAQSWAAMSTLLGDGGSAPLKAERSFLI